MMDHWQAKLKVAGIVVLMICTVIVVLQNTEEVQTKVLFMEFKMPRAFLLFLTASAGLGLGVLSTLLFQHRRKIAAHPVASPRDS